MKRRKRMADVPAQRQEANLAGLAEEINSEHRAFLGSLSKTAEHGIRAGELLAEAKNQCKHGEWLPWLRANFDGSERSAQVYMQMFRNRDEIRAKTQGSADLSIAGALREISPPSEADEKGEGPDGMSRETLEERMKRINESHAKEEEAVREMKKADEKVRECIDYFYVEGADKTAQLFLRGRAFDELGLAIGKYNMAVLGARSELKDYLDVLAAGGSSGAQALRERAEERLCSLEPLASEERGLLEQFYPEELARADAVLPRVDFFRCLLGQLDRLVRPADAPEGFMPEGSKKLTEEQANTTIAELLKTGAAEEQDVYDFKRWPHPLLWIEVEDEEQEPREWHPSEWWQEKARALAPDKTAT
jgi:Protein of unknown function (DUF3102)